MKRFLRVGFELCAEKERAYTRDLYPCYQVFSKYYPEQERNMYQALDWALNPIDDKQRLTEFIKKFGSWLATRAEEYKQEPRPAEQK
jgi:hypothetical protein